MDGIATLINQTFTQDSIGQYVPTETSTDIYVRESSITRSEWYNAGRQGLNPDLLLLTPRCNYDGQKIIEYRGKRYSVYRTYTEGEEIELYLTEKGGTYVGD